MDTLNAFETLAQKVELVLEKYEVMKTENESVHEKIDAYEKQCQEMRQQIKELTEERTVVQKRIDAILAKIEKLSI